MAISYRKNSKAMKDLLGYMSGHHEDLLKRHDGQPKEIFEKFDD